MLDNKDKNLKPGEYQRNEIDVDFSDLAHKLSVEEKNVVCGLLENDPLDGSYIKSLIVYLVIAVALLLWPFDFTFFPPKNGVTWIKTSNGIEFLTSGQVISDLPAEALYNQLLSGTGLSLEVWAAPKTTDQSGPARIISYSLNPKERNFTLGQSHQRLVIRLRTTETDPNGVYPHMEVDNVFNSTEPIHITVTYDFSVQRVYVNGQIRAEKPIPGGNFSNWDPSHFLVLGNEVTGDRPWIGRLFYVSIYNRALEPHEIRRNYTAGTSREPDPQKKTDRASSGLVARYFFDKHTGDKINDSSGNLPPLNLHIPEKLKTSKKVFLGFSFSQFANVKDTFLNIIVFIPFGFLFSGILLAEGRSLVTTFFLVLVLGTLFTTSIESVQYFSEIRTSSLNDVITNILGTILGVVFFRSWKKLLKSRSRELWLWKCIGHNPNNPTQKHKN